MLRAPDLVTAPAALALDLEQVKKQCKLDGIDDDNDYLEDVVMPAVIERAEIATQRQLIHAVWALKLDYRFPACGWIEIPRPPLVSVTSVTYVTPDGTTGTLTVNTDYTVDAPVGPRCSRGRIVAAYGTTFPVTRDVINAVTVMFTAGYGPTHTAIPGLLRMAMLRDAAQLYALREDVITGTITAELPRSSKVVYQSFRSYGLQ